MRRAVAARGATVALLVTLAVAGWLLLVRSQAVMASMQGDGVLLDAAEAMMNPHATAAYLLASVCMWIVMMTAMMIPAVLPAVVLFSGLDRRGPGVAHAHGAWFAGGYLLVWTVFSLAATLLQWALHRAALLEGDLLATPPLVGGTILVAAGLYQVTPYKTACLAHCQSPLAMLLGNWRDGALGAVAMGARHGCFCLGCCWVVMLAMFTFGVMSTAAMVVLSLFVLAERSLPPGPWSARLPGIVLVAWGIWTLVRAAPIR